MKKISKLDLPNDFINTIQNTYGDKGFKFLNSLPDLIDEASRLWNITDIEAVPNLSYNFVAFANYGDHEVVLKIGVPNRELTSEMIELRLFNGRSSVRLLEADEAQGLFLVERLRPGQMLAELKDDERVTHTAASVMLDLWQPAPPNNALIQLSDWFKGFERLRTRFAGGTGPLDKILVEKAEGYVKEFFSEDYVPMLIHGDLHHFNILTSSRGWLAIDPKGVIGPAAYEVGPFLINPWNELDKNDEVARLTNRQIAILSERLAFERERIRAWGIAHAVLSAWWSLEEGAAWEYAMNFAGLLTQDGLN